MRILGVVLCVAALAPPVAPAGDPPEQPVARIEMGLGAMGMGLPDYRGSDRYGSRAFPFPYLVYHSERLQVTREGVRARLFSADRFAGSLSAAASLPGTADNEERAGMPKLDPTFEIGPSLDYLIHRPEDPGDLRMKVRLPARAAVAVDGIEFNDVGWVFVPHLRMDYSANRGMGDWSHLIAIGALYATKDYHEYYYGVAPEFACGVGPSFMRMCATPELNRPAYDAHGGYSSAFVSASSVVKRGLWRFGAFVSYDYMDGAAFGDSPLFRSEHSVVGGLYVTYQLYAAGVGEPLKGETH